MAMAHRRRAAGRRRDAAPPSLGGVALLLAGGVGVGYLLGGQAGAGAVLGCYRRALDRALSPVPALAAPAPAAPPPGWEPGALDGRPGYRRATVAGWQWVSTLAEAWYRHGLGEQTPVAGVAGQGA